MKRLLEKLGVGTERTGYLQFLGQSTWLVIATAISGICMLMVHPAAVTMSISEYGVFFTLLRSMSLVSVPANALEATFSWKTANSQDESHLADIASTSRLVFKASLILFIMVSLLLLPIVERIADFFHVINSLGLWATLLVMLISVWLGPVRGMLQGAERFSCLGALIIVGSSGRLLFVFIFVAALGYQSAGAMFAVLIGQCLALAYGLWKTKDLWMRAGQRGPIADWISHAIPITAAPTAVLLLSTFDTFFVQLTFTKDETAFYMAPQLVGLAMLQFTSPIAAILFVRATRATATQSSSNSLLWAILTTGVTSGILAIGVNFFPSRVLSALYFTKPEFKEMDFLIPWVTVTTFTITILNVIVSNLLAIKSYKIVPRLAAVILVYFCIVFFARNYILSLTRNEGFLLLAQIAAFHAILGLLAAITLINSNSLKLNWERVA